MATPPAQVCSLCPFRTGCVPELVSHIRLVHHSDPTFSLTCGIDECEKHFKKCSSFLSHVYRHHRQCIVREVRRNNEDEPQLECLTLGEPMLDSPTMPAPDAYALEIREESEPSLLDHTVKCIFLVSIAASPIIRKHGIDEILNPFVRDLRDLAANKLHVFIDGKVREFEVALLAFLADNLGAHQIGGFKESMSFARRICRSCMTTTADAQHNFVESQFKLRTMEQHSKECDEAENDPEKSKEYGINRRSILESIPNFSCAEGLPHDIMHDLFEGVVPYELKLLLAYYITTKKYFTLHQLNMRIQNYGYGYTEVSDKPSQISDINHIRQSAAQMWLLASLLPLLIGNLVPEECEYWKCFITLLRICSIAAAWSVSSSTIDYLTVIIEEHHQLFKKLYPDMKIIPKMHYMVHYCHHWSWLCNWCHFETMVTTGTTTGDYCHVCVVYH